MNLRIREAAPEDAERIIEYTKRLIREPESNLELSEGEFRYSVEEEAAILREYRDAERSIFLIAEGEGRVLGLLQCKGSLRAKIRHCVTLGMSVARDARNRGIGSRLLAAAIEWANSAGSVRRIELMVFEPNARAIHLYKKFGFEIEGRKRRAVFRDGQYLDEYVMGLLL